MGLCRGRLLLAWLLISTAPAQAQNLVVNGSFGTPPVTNGTRVAYPDAAAMLPWQTTATNFEIWTNGWANHAAGIGPLFSADGEAQNMEILSYPTNATVWQTVPTVVGERYAFSFYYAPRPGAPADLFSVSVNSSNVLSLIDDGQDLTNFDWQQFTTSFVASSNLTTLSFSDQSLFNAGSGTHLDGVVLEHEPFLSIQYSSNSMIRCSWNGVSNEVYQLQYNTYLTGGQWVNLGPQMSGSSPLNADAFTEPLSIGTPRRYYRVVTGP
jgi:hypothetical protein